MATPCADPRSRYLLPFSSYNQQPSPRTMTTSPRRTVVPPRMSSSASALLRTFLLACWPVGLLACCLANVRPCARERARDWLLDASVGEDHLADACVDRLDGAHDLLFHPPFGELHERVGLGFRNL